jgi:hypothetical protein
MISDHWSPYLILVKLSIIAATGFLGGCINLFYADMQVQLPEPLPALHF